METDLDINGLWYLHLKAVHLKWVQKKKQPVFLSMLGQQGNM